MVGARHAVPSKNRMKNKIQILFVFLILIPFSAQAYLDSLVGLGNQYDRTVHRNTKHAEVYGISDLDAHYILFATFHSQEFRNAFAELYNHLYPQGQDGLANKLGHPWEDKPPQVEFFIGVYAKAKGLKKMSGPKNLWDLTLKLDGQLYQPVSVEEVTITPFEYKFYPYLDPWSRAYRVTFPVSLAQGEAHPMILQVANVNGKSELKFK